MKAEACKAVDISKGLSWDKNGKVLTGLPCLVYDFLDMNQVSKFSVALGYLATMAIYKPPFIGF